MNNKISFILPSALLLLFYAFCFADTEIGAGIGFSPWDSSFSGGRKDPMQDQDAHVKAIAVHFGREPLELMKLWHRGYGRNELIKLLTLSNMSGAPLEALIKARDKNTKLSKLCSDHSVSYPDVISSAAAARIVIDAKTAVQAANSSDTSLNASSLTFTAGSSTFSDTTADPSSTSLKAEQ